MYGSVAIAAGVMARGSRAMRDPYALLGNVIAVVAGLLVTGALLLIACEAAWSHQAAHAALEAFR
jgi:hypothetical protein